jgi:endonuclease-3
MVSDQTKISMLARIREHFPVEPWKPAAPFETLIHTILSQNTNDRNSDAAMKKLRKRYEITPRSLSRASLRNLIPCIRSAGLYRSKAPRIVAVSKIIQHTYNCSLKEILKLPYAQAKEELTAMPGVGPKTADIVLAFNAKHPVIPVDTHISRISKRLGIAPQNAGYETIRVNLEALISENNRMPLHLSLIEFGHKICKAQRPACQICPVQKTCPSSRL